MLIWNIWLKVLSDWVMDGRWNIEECIEKEELS